MADVISFLCIIVDLLCMYCCSTDMVNKFSLVLTVTEYLKSVCIYRSYCTNKNRYQCLLFGPPGSRSNKNLIYSNGSLYTSNSILFRIRHEQNATNTDKNTLSGRLQWYARYAL